MRPEFGCRIHDYVFARPTPRRPAAIQAEVKAALRRWEPRVDVDDVDVSSTPGRRASCTSTSRYAIRRTNDRRNLVFPFYVIPGGD